MRTLCTLLVSAVLMAAAPDPSRPAYVAKKDIVTTVTDASGKIIRQQHLKVTEGRTKNGDHVEQREGESSYTLNRGSDMSQYRVHPQRKLAEKTFALPAGASVSPTPADKRMDTTGSIGSQLIAGTPCYVFPLKWNSANSSANAPKISGTICHALDTDIVLEIVTERTYPDGAKMTVVDRITEIQWNVEPSPDLVNIPSDYQIIAPQGCNSCPNKPKTTQ